MLINHAIELTRNLNARTRTLKARAAATERRHPLVVVPPMLGTRLRGHDGRSLWGTTRAVFFGPEFGHAEDVRLDGLLSELLLVPGLYSQDIHGGLIRFLERIGGYRTGTDLFVLQYDWRRGVADGASELAALVDRVSATAQRPVDLFCVSSGGLLARYFAAYGGQALPGSGEPPTPQPRGGRTVRRIVYLGTPHRGSLEAMAVLQDGFRLVPFGRHFTARDSQLSQLTYDLLPHPEDGVLVDEAGRGVDFDVHDADAWRALGLQHHDWSDLGVRLSRARRLRRALDAAPEHPDTVVIGARHVATRARMLLDGGCARLVACCGPEKVDDAQRFTEPGDGSVCEKSVFGLPGLTADRLRYVSPPEHRWLPSDPDVHRHGLEALLDD